MGVAFIGVLLCFTPLETHTYDSGNSRVVPVYQQSCIVVDKQDASDIADYVLTRKSHKLIDNPYTSK